MLQLESKTLLAYKSVKGDPKLSDLLTRLDRNLSNFSTLSTKAFKHLCKLDSLAPATTDNTGKLVTAYESLAVYAGKMD